jgi:hypothetical protein
VLLRNGGRCLRVDRWTIVEPVDGGAVSTGFEVAVGVYGDLDGVVPELIAHIRKVLALSD